MLCTFSSACQSQLCGGPASCLDSFSVGLLWLPHHVTRQRKLCMPLPDEHSCGKPSFFLIHHRISSQ